MTVVETVKLVACQMITAQDLPEWVIMNCQVPVYLCLLTTLLAGMAMACWSRHSPTSASDPQEVTLQFHGARLTLARHVTLSLVDKDGTVKLRGELGLNLPQDTGHKVSQEDDQLQIEFSNGVQLTVGYLQEGRVERYDVQWEAGQGPKTLEDQFCLGENHWYGGAGVFDQLWPIEKWQFAVQAYVTGDSYSNYWGGTQERYWVSSAGAAVHVHQEVPLFVGVNASSNGQLTLKAQHTKPYQNSRGAPLVLQYTLILAENVRKAQDYAVNHFWRKPIDIPDKRLFRYPVWSTWAKYKSRISQVKVLQFADEITKHDFRHAQLEIDDDWTPHYGDFDFDLTKFPDARGMVDQLKEMGFRVTLWVHPFASVFSTSLWEKDSKGKSIWVTVPGTSTLPYLALWWNGIGASLDLTNPESVDWFTKNLHILEMKYGIDSFKFDAGETTWLPNYKSTHVALDNPNNYTKIFVKIAYESDQDIRAQEVRTSVNSQHLPMFVRLMDKLSTWDHGNGLRSVIPNVLTFGLIGYPFVLPDMIGGNAYTGPFIGITTLPDRELFIRWLEVNALLPSMQFSVAPWDFDQEVTDIAKNMTKLHEEYSDLIISLAEDSVRSGAPIIRPLWWVAPEDPVALTLDSEFLLGDDVLVAPVLEQGQTARDVYIPPGQWKDHLRGGTLEGGRWYHNYPALLHQLPVFTRATPS